MDLQPHLDGQEPAGGEVEQAVQHKQAGDARARRPSDQTHLLTSPSLSLFPGRIAKLLISHRKFECIRLCWWISPIKTLTQGGETGARCLYQDIHQERVGKKTTADCFFLKFFLKVPCPALKSLCMSGLSAEVSKGFVLEEDMSASRC